MSATNNTTEENILFSKKSYIELFSWLIWSIANNQHGKIKVQNFVKYVLSLFFYHFISENLICYINKYEQKVDRSLNYTRLSDQAAEQLLEVTIKNKGFFILPSELFYNIRLQIHNDFYFRIPEEYFTDIQTRSKKTTPQLNYGEEITNNLKNIYSRFSLSNEKLYQKYLFFSVDFNSPELGKTVKQRNKKLAKIMDRIDSLPIYNFIDDVVDFRIEEILEILVQIYVAVNRYMENRLLVTKKQTQALAKNLRKKYRLWPI